MDDVDALLKEERDTREINDLLKEAGPAPVQPPPPPNPAQDTGRGFDTGFARTGMPLIRPAAQAVGASVPAPVEQNLPEDVGYPRVRAAARLAAPVLGSIAGAAGEVGNLALLPMQAGEAAGRLGANLVTGMAPPAVARPGWRAAGAAGPEATESAQDIALAGEPVSQDVRSLALLASPALGKAGRFIMGTEGVAGMGGALEAAQEVQTGDYPAAGAAIAKGAMGALMVKGAKDWAAPPDVNANPTVPSAGPAPVPFEQMVREEGQAARSLPRNPEKMQELVQALQEKERVSAGEQVWDDIEQAKADADRKFAERRQQQAGDDVAMLRNIESEARRMEGENFDRTVRMAQQDSEAAQAARTPERLLSDLEGGLRQARGREIQQIPRAATGLPSLKLPAEEVQFGGRRRIGGMTSEPMPGGTPMRQTIEQRTLPPPTPADLPFGAPPLGPRGTPMTPGEIAAAMESRRPSIPPPPMPPTLEATGMRAPMASPESRLAREIPPEEAPPGPPSQTPEATGMREAVNPPSWESRGARQMAEGQYAPPEEAPRPPTRAPARAGAASPSVAGGPGLPDVQLKEGLKMVAPSGGWVERKRAELGNPSGEGNWFSRSNVPQQHAEAQVWRDRLREEIPQQYFGGRENLEAWADWARENPIASEAAMNLREGKPLSAQEQAFYQQNQAKIDWFLEGVGKVLNEVDAKGIAGGSLGPNYFPWEQQSKVGAMLSAPPEMFRPGLTKWSHLDRSRSMWVRPKGMNAGEVMLGYLDDLAEAIPQRQLERNIMTLRDQHLQAGNAGAATMLNEYLKTNVKHDMPAWERASRDLLLAPYRNTPVKVGDVIQSSGELGRAGTYEVVGEVATEKGPQYRVTVNGEPDPVLLSKDDVNAIRFQDVQVKPSSKMALVKRTLSHMYVSWNPASAIRAAISNVPRVAARLNVRDYDVAMKDVTRWATRQASKAELKEWQDAGAIGDTRSAGDLMEQAKGMYETAAFAGVVLPDKAARLAVYSGTKARLARLHPELSPEQIKARARVEMGIATDIAGDIYTSPGGQDAVTGAIKFLQGSSIRTAEQAWDVISSGNVPAAAKATIVGMAVAYPALKAMGGTWDDLESLVLGNVPFYGALSGKGFGAPALAAETVGKLAGAAKYSLETGMTPPMRDVPIFSGAQRIVKAAQTGNARQLFPVSRERWEESGDELAARKIQQKFRNQERRAPKEKLP